MKENNLYEQSIAVKFFLLIFSTFVCESEFSDIELMNFNCIVLEAYLKDQELVGNKSNVERSINTIKGSEELNCPFDISISDNTTTIDEFDNKIYIINNVSYIIRTAKVISTKIDVKGKKVCQKVENFNTVYNLLMFLKRLNVKSRFRYLAELWVRFLVVNIENISDWSLECESVEIQFHKNIYDFLYNTDDISALNRNFFRLFAGLNDKTEQVNPSSKAFTLNDLSRMESIEKKFKERNNILCGYTFVLTYVLNNKDNIDSLCQVKNESNFKDFSKRLNQIRDCPSNEKLKVHIKNIKRYCFFKNKFDDLNYNKVLINSMSCNKFSNCDSLVDYTREIKNKYSDLNQTFKNYIDDFETKSNELDVALIGKIKDLENCEKTNECYAKFVSLIKGESTNLNPSTDSNRWSIKILAVAIVVFFILIISIACVIIYNKKKEDKKNGNNIKEKKRRRNKYMPIFSE